jgi:hypothetical protein
MLQICLLLIKFTNFSKILQIITYFEFFPFNAVWIVTKIF